MARQMKDSRIEWIGELPEKWSTRMLFQIFSEVKNKNEGLIENNLLSLSYGKIKRKNIDSSFGLLPESFEGYNIIEKDDIVLRLTDLQNDQRSLRTGLAGEQGIVTSAYTSLRLRTTEASPNFMHYSLHVFDVCKGFYGMGAGVRQGLNWSGIRKLVIPWCGEEEQRSISGYLDTKCAEIDKVVEQTRATIEEYKKLKQAIITEAVTKGVRGPRPMKPSGVEWIGDIPEEWDVLKTLWLLEMPITDGPHETPTLYDDGIPFISAEAVSCGRGGIDFSHKRGYISRKYYDECCKKYTPRLHDIYMIKSGATTGRVSMVDTEELFTIWSPLAVLRANQEKMLPRFLFYSLQADYYQKQISLSWSFGTQQNIGMRVLEQLKIATPDTNEQQEIATYLDAKCTEIDRIIEKKEQLIEELGSYKKSLIYEYVTGKKEVTA